MAEGEDKAQTFLEHLKEFVKIATVSHEDRKLIDWSSFDRAHRFLAATYPLVHQRLAREVVARHSLLFTWEGTSRAQRPILLMGHFDVVPVEPGTESAWEHPPFSGEVADGFLWGRGAFDDKAGVIALLEATESLLRDGFRPARPVYLAFGHDEEIGGQEGAGAIARLLAERQVRLEFALDEGGVVVDSLLPGVEVPVALIGIGEKGYLNVEITASSSGGHSSVPPRRTAIGLISAALQRLEEHPLPADVRVQRFFFEALAETMKPLPRFVMRHTRLFRPLIERRIARSPRTDALIRTTQAPTIIEGGVKPNVLPQRARAVVNFRIRPGESRASVLEHVRRTVGNDVTVETLASGFSSDPTPLSAVDCAAFDFLRRVIGEVFPAAVVAPWVMIGATDSRHFVPLSENVYRFNPFRISLEDFARVHGANERFRLADAAGAVTFFRRLIECSCRAG